MISFFLTMFRLALALRRGFRDSEFRALLILVLLLLTSGTIFYSSTEGWGWLDALYFSVATLSIVGHGELTPHTSTGKVFIVVYIFVGMGVFIALASNLAVHVLGQVRASPDGKGE